MTAAFSGEPETRPRGRIARFDDWCERVGDRLNPIVVKETRQALKSRQFLVTFSLLLVAALGWTVIGSLSMMPQIYTSPSAPAMLIGYYVLLAVPMLLVVPLAAYRSLEAEIDDGTLELLAITTLRPRQIVLGKLAGAMLQMLLYFVTLFPCVAYAYTLRGVDLPTTVLTVGILAVAAVVMTIYSLFFAPLARTRGARIGTLLGVLLPLLTVEYLVGGLVVAMITRGNPLSAEVTSFLVVFVLVHAGAIGHLLLTATAAQLTPESENRSTALRLSLLGLTAVSVATMAYGLAAFPEQGAVLFVVNLSVISGLWILCGSLFAAESPAITPRIRRELPRSFAARMLLTFLTPGPSTGLVFGWVGIISVAILSLVAIEYVVGSPGMPPYVVRSLETLRPAVLLAACYCVVMLAGVRWVVAIVRLGRRPPRIEVGFAAAAAIAVLAALIPYSMGLHYNDYRAYPYSAWQATNWAWTLSEAIEGNLPTWQIVATGIIAAVVLLAHVIGLGAITLPRRTATPWRVQQERRRMAAAGDRVTAAEAVPESQGIG